jgi:hypothetical protein
LEEAIDALSPCIAVSHSSDIASVLGEGVEVDSDASEAVCFNDCRESGWEEAMDTLSPRIAVSHSSDSASFLGEEEVVEESSDASEFNCFKD